MLSCNPIGNAADLSSPEESGILPFSPGGWTTKLRLTKKVLKHKAIFPKMGGLIQKENPANHDFIFQRFLSMRNSFKSLKLSSSASVSPVGRPPLPVSVSTPKKNFSLEGSSSKDSGLGEEEEALGGTQNTPPSSGGSSSSGGGILTHRSPSEASSHHKKHVMIREPSLSHLPSARRRILNSCRVVRTRVYKGPRDLPDSTSRNTVSTQWDNLYTKAYQDLQGALPELEPRPLKVIFQREEPKELEVEEISSILRTIYSILYADWRPLLTSRDKTFLSLSLHCIQMFLVGVVRLLDLKEGDGEDDHEGNDEDEDLKERFERKFTELLKSCELIGYSNVETCLRKSQRVFVQFWCSLLNVPVLKDSFSPQERKNILRLSLRMATTTGSTKEEELRALKHRSSIF